MFLNSIYVCHFIVTKTIAKITDRKFDFFTNYFYISRLNRTTPFTLGILWSYKNYSSSAFTWISSYDTNEIEHYIRPVGNNAINCRE